MTPIMVKRFILLLQWAEIRMSSANPSGQLSRSTRLGKYPARGKNRRFSAPGCRATSRELLRALARLKQTKEVARIGDLKLQSTESTSHVIPPILSGGALVLGVVLIGAGFYQKR